MRASSDIDPYTLARWLAIAGGSALTTGAVTVLWPAATLLTVAWLVRVHLVVAGIVLVVARFHAPGPASVARVVLGGLVVVAATVTLAGPGATESTFALTVGTAFIGSGGGNIVMGAAWPRRFPASVLVISGGALAVVVGLMILRWPDVNSARLSQLAGLFLMASGMFVSFAAWRVRKLAKRLDARARLQLAVLEFEIWADRQAFEGARVVESGHVEKS